MGKKIAIIIMAIVLVFSSFAMSFADVIENRDVTTEESYATQLKKLGLFKGVTDTDFDLDRAPTRVEALVMLIRVLGVEEEALNWSGEHPFTDVPKWADSYVGYAYENGLTNGISATKFGTGTANAQMYVTYMLRALGYSDKEGIDFTYSDPFTLAKSLQIFPENISKSSFMRADAVAISYYAMNVNLKDEDITLAESLIEAGVFSRELYEKEYIYSAVNTFKVERIGEKQYEITFTGPIFENAQYLFAHGMPGDNTYEIKTGADIINHKYLTDLGGKSAWGKYYICMYPEGIYAKDFIERQDWTWAVPLGVTGHLDKSLAYHLEVMKSDCNGLSPGEIKHFSNKVTLSQIDDLHFRVHIEDNYLDEDLIVAAKFVLSYEIEQDEYQGDEHIYGTKSHKWRLGGWQGVQGFIIEDGDLIVDISAFKNDNNILSAFSDGSYEYTITYLNNAQLIYSGGL